MNILEEIPNSKSPSKSPLMSKDSPTSASTPSSTPGIIGSISASASKSPVQKEDSPNGALSDAFLVFDLRTLIIIVLAIMVAMTYFGFNVLAIFGDAIQKGVDILSPTVSQFLQLDYCLF